MIKAIIAKGVGFTLGTLKWIPTHGFSIGAAVVTPSAPNDCRIFTVPAESRTLAVVAEDRTYSVGAESRIYEVPCS